MKCLSVVPGSFPGEEVRERNHCLFSGGLRSKWWPLLDSVFHPKLLFKITFYVSLMFLTHFVFFMFVRFSSRVRGQFIQHLSFGGLRDKVIFGSFL